MSKAPRKLVVLAVAPMAVGVALLPIASRLQLPDGLLGCGMGFLIGLSALSLLAMAGKMKCSSSSAF